MDGAATGIFAGFGKGFPNRGHIGGCALRWTEFGLSCCGTGTGGVSKTGGVGIG